MSRNASALLILAAFATIVPAAIIFLSWFVDRFKKKVATDVTPYECGVKPFESARKHFSIKFYIVAMLFILFDVEAAFLYPWAVALKDQARLPTGAGFTFATMLVFLGILVVGYVYARMRGAFDWDR